MEAAAERERRAMKKIVAQAWWNGALNDLGKHLKPLKHYLDRLEPQKPQTGEEVIAVWREHAARDPGKIRIRHIGPDGKELN